MSAGIGCSRFIASINRLLNRCLSERESVISLALWQAKFVRPQTDMHLYQEAEPRLSGYNHSRQPVITVMFDKLTEMRLLAAHLTGAPGGAGGGGRHPNK